MKQNGFHQNWGKVQSGDGGTLLGLAHISKLFVFITFVTLIVASCGKQSTNTNKSASAVKTCELPDEQQNTLQGAWKNLPIKVSFHNGDFGSDETTEIVAAAATWNSFFHESKGTDVFDSSTSHTSAVEQSGPACGSGTLSDGAILYKRSSTWTKSKSAVAITTFCTRTSSGKLKVIFNAVMEFNFKHFFVENTGKYPDIQSIALHELGHLMGLDHSCGPLKNNAPNVACPNADEDPGHELVKAVMFPQVFFDPSTGFGEEKRALTANDQGRANCLYNTEAE